MLLLERLLFFDEKRDEILSNKNCEKDINIILTTPPEKWYNIFGKAALCALLRG